MQSKYNYKKVVKFNFNYPTNQEELETVKNSHSLILKMLK